MTTGFSTSTSEDETTGIKNIIHEYFGESYDPNQRYIICIQGATSSGKSIFSKGIHKILTENGISSYLFPLDSYYFKPLNPDLDEEDYDFDNPAALDWINIFEVIKAIRDKKPYIEHNVYSSEEYTKDANIIRIPNIMPNVLIIEGIFGFNAINDKIFNIKEFDPYNSNKIIEKEIIDRDFNIGDFKILKVLMTHCASKLLSIRLKRDEIRGRSKEAIIKRFYDKTLPGTLKWVYSPIYDEYIRIIHGNFNIEKVKLLMDELSLYFLGKKEEIPNDEYMDINMWNEFEIIECTGECEYGGKASIILNDKKFLIKFLNLTKISFNFNNFKMTFILYFKLSILNFYFL